MTAHQRPPTPLRRPSDDLDGDFTMTIRTVDRDTSISPGGRLLFILLRGRLADDGWCYTDQETLAEDYGCTIRQVQRLLDELISGGQVLARPNPHSRGQGKAYAPIAGLIPAAAARVRAAGWKRANKTYPSPLETANTTSNTTDMSPLEPANTTYPSSLKEETGEPGETLGRPEIDTPVSDAPHPAPPPPITKPPVLVAPTPPPTPPSPAPQPAPPPIVASQPAAPSTKPAPHPNVVRGSRQARVIELIRAGGGRVPVFDGRDGRAIKEADATPEEIAACILDLYHRRWGDRFQQKRLRPAEAILDSLPAWLADHAAPAGGDRAHFLTTSSAQPTGAERLRYLNNGRTGPSGSRNGPIADDWLEIVARDEDRRLAREARDAAYFANLKSPQP